MNTFLATYNKTTEITRTFQTIAAVFGDLYRFNMMRRQSSIHRSTPRDLFDPFKISKRVDTAPLLAKYSHWSGDKTVIQSVTDKSDVQLYDISKGPICEIQYT